MRSKEKHIQPRTADALLLRAFSMLKLADSENATVITTPPQYNHIVFPRAAAQSAPPAHNTHKKYEFFSQEDVLCEFYEVKLGKQGFALRLEPVENTVDSLTALKSQGFALRHKHLETAVDGLPAFNKHPKTAVDTLSALKKCQKTVVDGFPVLNKCLETVVDALLALDKCLETTVDGFSAVKKCLETTVDTFPALDKCQKTAVDSISSLKEHQKTAVDGLPAFNNYLETAVDTLTALKEYKFCALKNILYEFCKAKLGKQGFALRHKYAKTVVDTFPTLKMYQKTAVDGISSLKEHPKTTVIFGTVACATCSMTVMQLSACATVKAAFEHVENTAVDIITQKIKRRISV